MGGAYRAGGPNQAFVATGVAGTWTPAIPVPALATLDGARDYWASTVAWSSPGDCMAGVAAPTPNLAYHPVGD